MGFLPSLKACIPPLPKFSFAIKLPTLIKKPAPRYTPPAVETRKNHEQILQQVVEPLTNIEKKMSSGGAQIVSYMNDLQVNVGAQYIGADVAPAVSVVDGYPVPKKIVIEKDRTDLKQTSSPHVQSVTHSIPWGTYGIVASNKYNAIVGAGGIMMHTDGCVDINSGGRTTISSLYEMNLTSSSGNINIICGHNINIKGNTVTVQTTDSADQVVVNSNLGISRNLTVHGSTYIDGELFCQHITAPAVARLTAVNEGKAVFADNTCIGYCTTPAGPGLIFAFGQATADVLPHAHAYYTIASDLHGGNADVRSAAATDINAGNTGVAKSQTHGGTGLVS